MCKKGPSYGVEAALRERVKELTCLYGIAQIAANPITPADEILAGIVELIPPAWQYPESTCSRLVLDDRSYETAGFRECRQKQQAEIRVGGSLRGFLEIGYLKDKPDSDEGPFLKEERNLINAIAGQISLIIQRKQAEEERANLQQQIRRADRLATIGLLAAGVAHELNEPLGNILGFAQLAKQSNGLPAPVKRDIEKIEAASLNAREVIKKLLLFARQMPSKRTRCDLNDVIEHGLLFLESRCLHAGVDLRKSLEPDLPRITADPTQVNQVLVNLVVNALQAMPEGGSLSVQTRAGDDHVSLIVEDEGTGMSEAVLGQIFVPFFTTKDIGQGTGLGLPVVHGIVTSHGGSVQVDSKVGRGTRVEIRLPLEVKQKGD